MSTVNAILEPQPDGTIHVPVPHELRDTPLRVIATLEPASVTSKAFPDEDDGKTLVELFEEFRKAGGLKDIIPDPVAWQREQRKDRKLYPDDDAC